MTDARSGRVNALAIAILDADGDLDRLAEQMRFFRDLTDADVDRALTLAHWVKTTGGPQFVQQLAKPFGLVPACAETACPA
jgi:hypothetical protein